jgi:hypothetical protein
MGRLTARSWSLRWPLGLIHAAAFLGALVFAACQSTSQSPVGGDPGAPPAAGTDPSPDTGDFGSITFQLTTPGGFTFTSIGYDITGPAFHKTGSIDVSQSPTIAATVGGIPFGTGYVLTLTAQDTAANLAPCSSSATFDITSSAPVSVSVHLACKQVKQTTPPPPSVPIPREARYLLAAALVVLGASRVRRSVGA